jgi:hypothetical protein
MSAMVESAKFRSCHGKTICRTEKNRKEFSPLFAVKTADLSDPSAFAGAQLQDIPLLTGAFFEDS